MEAFGAGDPIIGERLNVVLYFMAVVDLLGCLQFAQEPQIWRPVALVFGCSGSARSLIC
jgi:hypothetical protein